MSKNFFLKQEDFAGRVILLPFSGKTSFDSEGKALVKSEEIGSETVRATQGLFNLELVSVESDGKEVSVGVDVDDTTDVDEGPSVEDVIETLENKATSVNQLRQFAANYFKDKKVEDSEWEKLKKAELSEFLVSKVKEFSK